MTMLAHVLRAVCVFNAFFGLICLIPFKGISRIHPLLFPAMGLFAFYDVTLIISEATIWNAVFSIRLVFSIALSLGSLLWAVMLTRVAGGRRVRVWPFDWSVKAYTSPTDVWHGDKQVYKPGEYDENGVS